MRIDLPVTGAVPTSLSGRYARIGDGMVHAVRVTKGRDPSYSHRSTPADATNVFSFGSAIFAFVDGGLAYELDAGLDTMRRVDFAGARRNLTSQPEFDPNTGELHVIADTSVASPLHVSVSPGGLTRTVRSIDNAPSRIRQLGLTRDHVVLLADGFVGVTDRTGFSTDTRWFPIDTDARCIAAAHDDGDAVVVYSTGPSLVRWTLRGRATAAHSHVLDATPQAFATSNSRRRGATHRYLWTAGSDAVHKHDLLAGTRRTHDFGGGRHPGALVFVADPDHCRRDDGGWLVGFVHDEINPETDFVVLDAHAIEQPAVAVVHIPRRIPNAGRGAWITAVQI